MGNWGGVAVSKVLLPVPTSIQYQTEDSFTIDKRSKEKISFAIVLLPLHGR